MPNRGSHQTLYSVGVSALATKISPLLSKGGLAVPGKIITINAQDDPLRRTGRVRFGGVIKEVSRAYVLEAKVDDDAIVHVGFALSVLDLQAAEQTLSA